MTRESPRPVVDVDALIARDRSALAPNALWTGGDGGYTTYRIPALVSTADGTVLAFCEGRRAGRGDSGQIDLLLRRSGDGGHTWSPTEVVVSWPGFTVGNPTPVLVRETGDVLLVFCSNEAQAHESTIRKGLYGRDVWTVTSADGGLTWGTPVQITSQVMRDDWTWYATGPCHAIQLDSGRLLVPCNHRHLDTETVTLSRHAHVIYSDDLGVSWHLGGGIDVEGANESVVVETRTGVVYLNSRDQHGRGHRFTARSDDGGLTFGDVRIDETLSDPPCQATALAVTRLSAAPIVFLNPAGPGRSMLTARVSLDDGRTWKPPQLIHSGLAAYSDLVQIDVTESSASPSANAEPIATLLALFETGDEDDCERIALVRLTVDSAGAIGILDLAH